jgi:trans-aconitate methyltransferase
MDLASQYDLQYQWRSWQQAYALLPPLAGARVLDLGCAVGSQARDLATRGALVLGIDANSELVARARSRQIPGASFELGDIGSPKVEGSYDGIWASFVAAYFPRLAGRLALWRTLLRPGGWIALTEVAGMFEHEPLPMEVRNLLAGYVRESCEAGRYDFDMGSKLAGHLEEAGFRVEAARTLADRELSFAGPADADVLQGWKERLARMRLLQARARLEAPAFERDFLACLSSPAHTTRCLVHFCVARRL